MTILTPASHDLLDDPTACEPKWRMTLGAQVESGGVRFRVWAPKRVRLDVVLEEDGRSFPLTKDEAGYFSALDYAKCSAANLSSQWRMAGFTAMLISVLRLIAFRRRKFCPSPWPLC